MIDESFHTRIQPLTRLAELSCVSIALYQLEEVHRFLGS